MPGVHVVVVAPSPSPYTSSLMAKHGIQLQHTDNVPQGAYIVSGNYSYSKEIAGVSRAFLGVMSGKSWTRAQISITQDGAKIFNCAIDGKYMGGGYSYGYETLGANEGLGMGLVQVVVKLNQGKPVRGE